MGRYYARSGRVASRCVAGHRGALSSALCRRCSAVDENRPSSGLGRQDRHAGRNLCHRATPDGRQGSVWPAPRRLGRPAHFARVAVGLGFGRCAGCGGGRAAGAARRAWPTRFTISSPSACAECCSNSRARPPRCSTRCWPTARARRWMRVTRLAALKEFLLLPDAVVLAAINKRIANILKKTQVSARLGRRSSGAHRRGRTRTASCTDRVARSGARGDPATPLRGQLAGAGGLRAPVNDFFDRVMVMDEDAAKRNNRLALLRDVQILLGGVADLSRLPG